MDKKTKIVGINTLFLIPGEVGGTEYLTRSFLKQIEKSDSENQYVVFCNKENYSTFEFSSPMWRKVCCPIWAKNKRIRLIYEQIIFPFLIKKYHCNLLHSFGYFGPIFSHAKQIVTVHDANWKDHPEDAGFFSIALLNFLCSANIHSSDAVITDSNFGASRLAHYFPKAKNKICVVTPVIDEEFSKLQNAKTDHPVNGDTYALCVSAFYPHKRIPYLLTLWEIYSKTNSKHKLIIVGNKGKNRAYVVDKINQSKNCILYDQVSLKELAQLYQHASVFIHPSIYEGFGMPIYEAASFGLPLLVGKKELYSQEISQNSIELTFQVGKDIIQLAQMLDKPKKLLPVTHQNSQSTKELIHLYKQLG